MREYTHSLVRSCEAYPLTRRFTNCSCGRKSERSVDQSVAMEAELLAVETQLSQRPAQEINDTTALTGEQQSLLDKHKVLWLYV